MQNTLNFSTNSSNFNTEPFPGLQHKKQVLIYRLSKMKVEFDPTQEKKTYFAEKYDEALKLDSNRAKILEDLQNDKRESKLQNEKKKRFNRNDSSSLDKSVGYNENSLGSRKIMKLEESKASKGYMDRSNNISARNSSKSLVNDIQSNTQMGKINSIKSATQQLNSSTAIPKVSRWS